MTDEQYIKNGLANNNCETMKEWLVHLSDTYDVDIRDVIMLARVLGPSEVFDGLVVEVQDYKY